MIKDSAEKGKSAYAISKELGISKNTAKKYMEQPAQVHGRGGNPPLTIDFYRTPQPNLRITLDSTRRSSWEAKEWNSICIRQIRM